MKNSKVKRVKEAQKITTDYRRLGFLMKQGKNKKAEAVAIRLQPLR